VLNLHDHSCGDAASEACLCTSTELWETLIIMACNTLLQRIEGWLYTVASGCTCKCLQTDKPDYGAVRQAIADVLEKDDEYDDGSCES